MASIQAIPSSSVHLIQSGQVILSLENAIKELVENSLDAGATIIEVKVKNYGLDFIGVIDNGCGIKPEDWEGVALKHHTSKFSSSSSPSSDLSLADVSTFGFRGEALSSLCALAGEVVITTATTEMSGLGVKLKFGRNGVLMRQRDGVTTGLERIARQRGTTVLISNLFQPFPVRRKEFERTAKREFAKALGVCLAYGLVPAIEARGEGGVRGGVRLTVDSISSTGKKINHLKTDGKPCLRSAISSIWGPKSLDGLIPVDLTLKVQTDKMMARREGIDVVIHEVNVVGLISSAAFGSGRTSTDRQYLYVNGRPFSAPKLIRAINEVYHSFNPNQSPFVVLDLKMPRDSIDVNVSPDKREIFLHSELDLIEALRNGLERLYQPALSTFVEGDATQTRTNRSAKPTQPEAPQEEESLEVELEERGSTPTVTQIPPPSRRDRERSTSSTSARSGRLFDLAPRHSQPSIVAGTPSSSVRPSGMSFRRVPAEELEYDEDQDDSMEVVDNHPQDVEPYDELLPNSQISSVESDHLDDEILATARNTQDALPPTTLPLKQTKLDTRGASWSVHRTEVTVPGKRNRDPPEPPASSQKRLRGRLASFARYDGVAPAYLATDKPEVVVDAGEPTAEEDSEVEEDDDVSMEDIPRHSHSHGDHGDLDHEADRPASPEMKEQSDPEPEVVTSCGVRRTRVRCLLDRIRCRYAHITTDSACDRQPIATPAVLGPLEDADISVFDPERAEAALSRVISKDDFDRMEILGQFNSSFIIARLRHDASQGSSPADDLFIIDQHASDEKYNFESLQQTTKIKAQTLFQPRKLELTSADEITAVDNLAVLEANGFQLSVQEDAAYGRGERIKLIAMPVSKETVFDFKDLEEIIYLLQDRPPGTMVRCKKARAMFAMRACRKSVMFGKPLGKAQMVQVVRHLGTLDQPWNCPHGRPTLRHLINLHKVTSKPSAGDRASIRWTAVDLS